MEKKIDEIVLYFILYFIFSPRFDDEQIIPNGLINMFYIVMDSIITRKLYLL